MEIIYLRLEDLTPYEKNPRNNKESVKYVAESIKEFGFKVPIIIDRNNVIVAGHTRYKAAKKLKMTEVPCIIADDLTPDQVKAFRLADNKVGEFSEWDMDLLMEELQDIDMAMDVFGFEEFGVGDGDNTEAQEDFFEMEPPKQPKAKLGDLYLLGNHRLLCGDCTSQEDVEKLTDGEEMDLCITDPPYNVNYGEKVDHLNEYNEGNSTDGHILNDNMDDHGFHQFLYDFYTQMMAALKPGGAFYIWHAESEGVNFRTALQEAGGQIRQCLIWNKNSLVLSRQDYHWKHEPCLYGWKEGAGHYYIDDRSQTTVFEDQIDVDKLTKDQMKEILKDILEDRISTTVMNEAKPTVNDIHPTMKPIKIIARLVKNSSRKGEKVVDFFGGSGSTLMACEQLGRQCYTMELDPKYVDCIIERWETFTGEKAVKLRG